MDTATRRGLVAAVRDGEVVAARAHEQHVAHAERLFGMIDHVLSCSAWSLSDVDLLAVGMGPGSFTGVRVGMAAAKGIGFARRIPIVGVTSLAAMAHATRREVGPEIVVSMLDAKKGEVFVARYGPAGVLQDGPEHIPRDDVPAWLAQPGAELERPRVVVGEVVSCLALSGVRHVQGPDCDLPGAASTAELARERWSRAGHDEIDSLEPLYVRPPDITMPSKP